MIEIKKAALAEQPFPFYRSILISVSSSLDSAVTSLGLCDYATLRVKVVRVGIGSTLTA